ncbi:MAG: bifunctional sulfate adenylyltransferase/adenylylsulfate kinase [Ectothiorhodospiraceae bacterium]|nr:bifunctional sulfate adenylyltransferase/adenylylsulfate kinase [Ectothiorhodospiraceae bacterium]MCH8503462.1 bifunctional sulfate adenylyltransferase/adenylylsulfate kinase [Ectothiorhodospiraceae bacterium]
MSNPSNELIAPHGGTLKELLVSPERVAELKKEAVDLPSWDLTARQVCDTELLLNGGFSPLDGFLTQKDYDAVCETMRLADGTLWPMPINLDVTEAFAETLKAGDRVALRHPEGMVLAVMAIEDIYRPDFRKQAEQVFGAADEAHPEVFRLFHQTNPVYLGGRLEGLELPPHHTFKHLRHTPRELRELFVKLGWNNIVAFQTRNPMHRAHVELAKRASQQGEANLLIHPVVGMTKPGDVDYFVRVRCYQEVVKHFPEQTTALSLLPLAMRMGGPREAVWHAIIRKNHGCARFIVGRDHAGPGKNSKGEDFYGPYDAQELVQKYEEELGITMQPFEEMVYVEDMAQYVPRSEVPEEARVLNISGTELRRRLKEGLELPEWFSYPEVIAKLRQAFPPKREQGFTVFFTGLSGSGKSTVANILMAKLMEIGTRPVTMLDGDLVRKHLSSELGFSKEHREINIKRIGYVASEITKNRGIAICAPIAPYAATRREVREMISQYGGFIEVHVSTPIEVCEERDRKGLYAKARAGLIKQFTGIDDPYEEPENPDVVVDTSRFSADELAHQVLLQLEKQGYIDRE